MTNLAEDTEYELKHGPFNARVGAFGASLRRFWVDTDRGPWDVVWGYRGRAAKVAGQGDVLMPFPSRLKAGRYEFEGRVHQLELNDKEGPNAIHGFLRAHAFRAVDVTPTRVTFAAAIRPGQFEGYPFTLDVEVTYQLSDRGLRTEFRARNVGDGPAPFGAGFHPYFHLNDGAIDEWTLELPAAEYLEFKDMVPTGRVLAVEGTPLDYRRPRPIGATRFGHCVQTLARDADGYARAALSAGDRLITLKFDRSFNYLVVYSGEAVPAPHTRRTFAIEPLTCATDAFNHPSWGLKVLAPGEVFGGHYDVGAGVVSAPGA